MDNTSPTSFVRADALQRPSPRWIEVVSATVLLIATFSPVAAWGYAILVSFIFAAAGGMPLGFFFMLYGLVAAFPWWVQCGIGLYFFAFGIAFLLNKKQQFSLALVASAVSIISAFSPVLYVYYDRYLGETAKNMAYYGEQTSPVPGFLMPTEESIPYGFQKVRAEYSQAKYSILYENHTLNGEEGLLSAQLIFMEEDDAAISYEKRLQYHEGNYPDHSYKRQNFTYKDSPGAIFSREHQKVIWEGEGVSAIQHTYGVWDYHLIWNDEGSPFWISLLNVPNSNRDPELGFPVPENEFTADKVISLLQSLKRLEEGDQTYSVPEGSILGRLDHEGMQVYTNETYGFKFRFPQTWKVEPQISAEGNKILLRVTEPVSEGYLPKSIRVSVGSFPYTYIHGSGDETGEVYESFAELADSKVVEFDSRDFGGYHVLISDGSSGECSPFMLVALEDSYLRFDATGINYCANDYIPIFSTLEEFRAP